MRKNDYVPLLRANNISEGLINHEDLVFVKRERVLDSQYLQQGDVLVCTSSGSLKLVGKAALILSTAEESFGAFCRVLRPDSALSASYFSHYFQSETYRRTISGKAAGANINNIRNEDLDDLQIPLPPLVAQRQIATRLDRICEIVEKRKAQLAQLQQLVKSRFVEMFGEGRYPIQRLSEIAEITGGLTKNGKRRTMSLKLKYLRVANVFYNRLDLSDVQEIGVEENEIPKTLLKKNDLLFVEGNGSIEQVGRVALWSGEIEPCLHQNHLIKVRLGNGIAPEYALFYFMSEAGRHQIKDCAVSTTGLHTLSTGKVANLHLPIPPLALQREFAAFVAKVDRLEAAVKKGLAAAERLYRQQLQEVFDIADNIADNIGDNRTRDHRTRDHRTRDHRTRDHRTRDNMPQPQLLKEGL